MNWIKQRLSTLIGQQAEQLACRYLQEHGLKLRQSNYHCRRGEIDLIMTDAEQLVFVEVKYRSQSSHGGAAEYFHSHKRRKFESAVAHYLHEHKLNPSITAYRIDLLAIQGSEIEWFKGV
ncbi:YraN family protein [Neptunicella sp. SCSIO 80796]|uniref:YraN family protein n=1 Tax=Neptunicella plasticusilytica TaxID=3117012 RepID=UPI003A4E4CA4